MDTSQVILLVTLLCQVSAIYYAFRLAFTYDGRWAWLFMAVGVVIMCVRTLEGFYAPVTSNGHVLHILDVFPSAFVLLAVIAIDPTFRGIKRKHEALLFQKRQLTANIKLRQMDLEKSELEKQRLEETLHQERERFNVIIATQNDIATAEQDLNAVMLLIVERTQEITKASGAVIEFVDGDDTVYQTASGRAKPHIGFRRPMATSFSGLSVRSGKILRSDDSEADPRVDIEECRRVGADALSMAANSSSLSSSARAREFCRT